MTKKWVSPLEKMIACEDITTFTVQEVAERIIAENSSKQNYISHSEHNDNIIEIDPEDCIKWQFKDRPENELGDINDLAENLKKNGQIHPVIIRKARTNNKLYELIVGERRWLAAQKANMKLKAIIKELSDHEAALIQISENDQRKGLSDYAKAIMIQQQIDAEIITPKDLETKLDKSQSYVRTLLSFSRLNKELISAIGDMRHISARSAYEIVRWQEKGTQYNDALIKLAPLLKNGKIGEKQLEKLLNQAVEENHRRSKHACEVHTKDGRHLFSWRGDTNKNMSISFPKSIRQHIDFKELESTMARNIEEQLKRRKEADV